jgi:hypothetical protein
VAGVLAGVAAAAAVGVPGPSSSPSSSASTASTAAPGPVSPSASASPSAESVPTAPAAADADLLLVWTSGGLPPRFDEALAGLPEIATETVIRGADIQLTAAHDADGHLVDQTAPGWYLPLDAFAVDPLTYGQVVPGGEPVAAALATPGSAVLSETSATVRRLGVGGTLQVAGGPLLTVTAVVPDAAVAAAEVVVSSSTGADLGIDTARAALVRYRGERSSMERSVVALLPPRTRVRFRAPGETTFLRHGDAVLPQSLIKLRFGEFAVKPAAGANLEIDPGWVAANIVDVTLPVLGRTRCNRLIVPLLVAALQELVDDGLTGLVDPASFGGCFAPRLIGPGLGLSRHAWGVAVDVNVAANPLGGASTQDPRLVEVMRRRGLASGADWLRPDPMHFEYLTPPR